MALCHAWTAIGHNHMSDDMSAKLLFSQGYGLAFKRYLQDS